MQFYFNCPLTFTGIDGVTRIVGEAEMLAELSGSPEMPHIEALYSFELAPGNPRFELAPGSVEFDLASIYLLSNVQERDRMIDDWPEDERPRASVVSEHSSYVGAP